MMARANFWRQSYRMFGLGLLLTATACTSPAASNSSAQTVPSAPTTLPAEGSSPASATDTPTTADPTLSAEQQQAAQVIRDYYGAIAQQDYEQAYAYWQGDGVASQQSLEEFKQGFAQTATVSVELGNPGAVEGAAGSLYVEIPVTVTAATTDGTSQRFCGSYFLRRINDVPGSTLEQRHWHLYRADLTRC